MVPWDAISAGFRVGGRTVLFAKVVESQPATVAREGIEASYSLTTTYRRNHQAWFSTLTKASVRNGLCMSALHHVAFDLHLIGVDPDFGVHVSSPLREQQDGELLEELKGLDGTKLRLPANPDEWPQRNFLERRFARFRATRG